MPTPVFCCGFECGVIGAGTHWTDTGASPASYSTSTVRSGARSIFLSGTGAATGGISLNSPPSSNQWVARFYIIFSTLPNANQSLATTNNAGSYPLCGLVFKISDSKLYAGSQTAASTYSFGATGVTVTTGVWYRVDMKVNLSANPWTVDISIDGIACGQYTNAVAGTTHNRFWFGTTDIGSYGMFVDDFILSNTAADFPIGAGYINHFVPTSDGTHNVAGAADFGHGTAGADIINSTTDAYTLVDDVPLPSAITTSDLISLIAPPNATDYVESVFGPAAGISTPTVAPRAVEVIAAIHQASTATGNMEIRLNDNGTTGVIYTATAVAGVTALAYKRAHFADPPSAATAWTLSGNGNFNNVRFRFGSPATVDAAPDQYLNAIMIEAEFAEVATIPNKIYKKNQAVHRAAYY